MCKECEKHIGILLLHCWLKKTLKKSFSQFVVFRVIFKFYKHKYFLILSHKVLLISQHIPRRRSNDQIHVRAWKNLPNKFSIINIYISTLLLCLTTKVRGVKNKQEPQLPSWYIPYIIIHNYYNILYLGICNKRYGIICCPQDNVFCIPYKLSSKLKCTFTKDCCAMHLHTCFWIFQLCQQLNHPLTATQRYLSLHVLHTVVF